MWTIFENEKLASFLYYPWYLDFTNKMKIKNDILLCWMFFGPATWGNGLNIWIYFSKYFQLLGPGQHSITSADLFIVSDISNVPNCKDILYFLNIKFKC